MDYDENTTQDFFDKLFGVPRRNPHMVKCIHCGGTGMHEQVVGFDGKAYIAEEYPCGVCDGTGEVEFTGDRIPRGH